MVRSAPPTSPRKDRPKYSYIEYQYGVITYCLECKQRLHIVCSEADLGSNLERVVNFTADVPLTRIAMPCWAKVGKDIAVEQGSKMYKRGK